MEEVEKTAYHEAGHCVAALLLGGFVSEVSLHPESEDGRHGEIEVIWSSQLGWLPKTMTVLAGPVAEMIYSGEPFHPGFVPEWSQDWKTAWQLATPKFRDERIRLRSLEKITKQVLTRFHREDCWSAIAAVADLLLAHELLESDQVSEEIRVWVSEW